MSFPVAIANAVADALGVEVTTLPLHGNVLYDLLNPNRGVD
jgi:2-furoyl-CoA dehydrogenase large subunit